MSANDFGDDPLDLAAARRALEWGFSAVHQARVAELLKKLKSETITLDERAELEDFNRANQSLMVLHSKARQIFRDTGE
jgi:hypothetical protein